MQDIIPKKKYEDGAEKVEVNKELEDTEHKEEAPTSPDTIDWSIEEYIFRAKSNDWYWSVGLATLALIVASFFFKNFLLAVISIIGGLSIALVGTKKPSLLNIKISSKGVQSENIIYLFEDIESFCINEDVPEEPRLFLKMKTGIYSHVILPIYEEDMEIIGKFLKEHLAEEQIAEPFSSALIRLLGI